METVASRRPHWDKNYTAVMLTVALPVIVQHVISIGLNLVDVLMIGKLGVDELAAVGAANRVYSVFATLCFGLISGCSVYIAQYWGQRDIKNIRRVYGLALASTGALSVLFMLLAACAAQPVLHLFVKDPAVIELGRRYIRIALLSYPFIAFSFATSFTSRSIRRMLVPTIINAVALATNTLLNYGLIFGRLGLPRWGVEGAALATVIARVLECALLLLYMYGGQKHPLAGKPSELFAIGRDLRRKVFNTTLPVLVNDATITLSFTAFYAAVGFLGTAAVAVMQVSVVVNEFFQIIFYGVGNAVAVITGNELGGGNKDNAYNNGKLALFVTVGLALLMGSLLLASRGLIVNVYDFDAATSAMLADVLAVRALFMLPSILVYVLICGILRAGGDTRFCMLVDACSVGLVGLPLSFIGVLLLHWQLPAVLALLLIGDIISCLLCLRRFRSKVWINTLV